MVNGAIYYFTENCLGYLGLCKSKNVSRQERIKLLKNASLNRKAAADYIKLRTRINKVLAADYVVLH
ncbi:hypothetical protein QV08_09630 [Gallibacterium salpingitidis]|uniref:hypothetical protein n=1 Tax=Gallibacterium salpingitidis TaxID=505341 RepID=UPI000805267B|nr:hypothetical protein [Gallibacterium salpingitidis]OBX06658.1 hypothetical protein QV08_09630 [Gallibacterium salpingitidis]